MPPLAPTEAFPQHINVQSRQYETPLYIAVGRLNVRCVEYLLEAGADPNIPNRDGETSLYTGMRFLKEMLVNFTSKFFLFLLVRSCSNRLYML